ncbi:MAG TPA: hypothetical protein ENI05_06860 [Porticoccus sp.]|nr:hypothetical protein [Porticoccus sp.]
MPRASKQPKGSQLSDQGGGVRCSQCGLEMMGWKQGSVIHCEGSNISFGCILVGQVHHGKRDYYCKKCQGYLGCNRCASNNPSCLRCRIDISGSRIVDRAEAAEGMKIIRMVATRQVTTTDGLKLINELFKPTPHHP